jgi:hypothetical protein
MAEMVKIRPPSPPSSSSGDAIHHDLHHLLQHNANTSYPHEAYEYDERLNLGSQSQSSYGSPQLIQQDQRHQYQYQQPRYVNQVQLNAGPGIQYVSVALNFDEEVTDS